MPGGYDVADVLNQALDMVGWSEMIGDPEEGTHHAQVALRAYRLGRQQVLRAANWSFARKQAPMTLLADASGNTPDVGLLVPFNWTYEYRLPTDALRMRFIPWNYSNQASQVPTGNYQIPSTPLVDGLGQIPPGTPMVPAKFQIATDQNYLPPSPPTDQAGVSPQGQTVVLTNVRYAQAVYTADMLYPSIWDALFRAAMVAYIAVECSLPVWAKKDPKMGLLMRDKNIPILRDKLQEARVVDGNAGTSSSDIATDWIRGRRVGGTWTGGAGGWGGGLGGFGGDAGIYGLGYDSLMVSSGAVF